MFSIGQHVIHPGQGVCTVVGFRDDTPQPMLLLEAKQGHAQTILMYPVAQADRLHAAISQQDAEHLLSHYDELECDTFTERNSSLEETHFKQQLKLGAPETVRVAKTMMHRIRQAEEADKKPSSYYMRVLKEAKRRSIEEFAVALGVTEEAAEARLAQAALNEPIRAKNHHKGDRHLCGGFFVLVVLVVFILSDTCEHKESFMAEPLSAGITRDRAFELLNEHNKDPFHITHGETVEGTMRYFAREFDPENEEFWGIVGLLHDLDWEEHEDDPMNHTIYAAEILEGEGASPDLIRAIQTHTSDFNTSLPKPELQMEKILFACDELTGLIGAAVIMRPSKSVMDFTTKSLKKKFKDKRFAAGCSRDVITQGAEMLGWELPELFDRTIAAMQSFAPDRDTFQA